MNAGMVIFIPFRSVLCFEMTNDRKLKNSFLTPVCFQKLFNCEKMASESQ